MAKKDIKVTPKQEMKLTEVLNKVPNRFLLSVAVAKRARQLKEGARPLVEVADLENLLPIDVALEEIAQGKINVSLKDKVDEDQELIEEMSHFTDVKAAEPEEAEAKKEKPKSKSRSLAA